jgi:RNA polymerase sigma-70 factor (ECF subfamily)
MVVDADMAVMQRLAAGDGAALAELYDRHGRAVYSLALRILGDSGDAEDLTQDVFTLAWRNAAKYDPSRGAVAAWLLITTRTRGIDRLRSRRARPRAAGEDEIRRVDAIPDAAPSVELVAATAQAAERVKAALEDLPPDMRAAVTLAYFEGLSHSEISERTGTPLGTIKTRIRSGLARLRQALEDEEGGLAG